MLNWLKSRFAGPKPAGPPQVLQVFAPDQPTITQIGIRVEHGAWHIDARAEEQKIRLFEVKNPAVEQCLLTYRAELKAEGLQGRAFLEMWCRLPGRGEFFSKGHQQAVSGTVNWARYEIPFYLRRGQKPELIKLNVVVEGQGTVWLRDVELLKTALAS
ncbi:MAG TPA: hypothetical protein VE525_14240 [Rubrobacter sp.]|jgi:hypothetical protein|nr:hypothetical protein [Rubrobacter sp.]